MKTSQKNGLRILFFVRDYPKRRESYVPAEEMEPRPSSDRDGRIYRLAVPVLKKKKKKFVISRRSRCRDGTKCTKKRDVRAELLFCQLNPLLFDVSDARRRHSFIVRERRTREEEQVQYYSLILQSVCYHGVALTTIYMVNQCSETTLILRLPLCLFNRHVK